MMIQDDYNVDIWLLLLSVINPWRACAARVTIVVPSGCSLALPDHTLKYQEWVSEQAQQQLVLSATIVAVQ